MKKIYIYETEWFPVYEFEEDKSGDIVDVIEISDEKYNRLIEIFSNFNKARDYLMKLYKENQ